MFAVVVAAVAFVLLRRRGSHPEAVLVSQSPKPPTPRTPLSVTSTSMQALSRPSSEHTPSTGPLHSRGSAPLATPLSAELAVTTHSSGPTASASPARRSHDSIDMPLPAHMHSLRSMHSTHSGSWGVGSTMPSSGDASSFLPGARHMFRRSQVQRAPASGRSSPGSSVGAQHAQHGGVADGRVRRSPELRSGSSSGSARSLFQAAVANMQVRPAPASSWLRRCNSDPHA